ncbi:MAG: FHA domain-containing protein [Anaerolineae bacterium]
MICSECQHKNREGVLICENCGSDIYDILVGEAQTKEVSRESNHDLRLTEPASSRPLMLYIADGSAPISVKRLNEQVIGRSDPLKTDYTLDIDLAPFNAQQLGVSRQHARLDAVGRVPHLIDLGSYTGRYIYGVRLNEAEPYSLDSGDEIQFGRLKMRIYFK